MMHDLTALMQFQDHLENLQGYGASSTHLFVAAIALVISTY
jgi:hypothetical protein